MLHSDSNRKAVNICTGQLSSSPAHLSSVTFLSLGHNRLYGSIPAWIAKMPKLQHLNISFNDLTGTLVDDAKFSRVMMTSCFLFNILLNHVSSGMIPSDLLENEQLTSLSLHCNAFLSVPFGGRRDVKDDIFDCRSSGHLATPFVMLYLN